MANVVDAEFSYDEVDDGNKQERAKTLVDLSLDSDPEMKDVLVEFVEFLPSGNQKFIDCKLPFTVDLDGVTYAVGTPNDAMVAVITDDENGETIMLDADDDSKEEIFQIAAAALVKYIGEDLRLKRTPRILTVEGDLNSYTDKWTQEERVSTEDLLMTEEENDQFLDDFFRDELGPNYEEEFLVNEQSNEKAQKLMDLFNVPGLGTEKDDDEGIRKMFDEMVSGIDISSDEVDNTKALPLFPFTGPDDKTYALVQITHPMLLIGKEDPSIENSQRLLLNIEESAQILPQVRSEFREIMERNDLLNDIAKELNTKSQRSKMLPDDRSL
eukprot:CAMPEP_0113600400 /NCGR_PEP_ID=MMETSP0015_2-20120614/42684_1 /TAXON_ID=2838 /ORGANISM="Odontella" /LENGTH=326 /DNA_ID=CAMNT_0000508649 /DNA_START=273 /DNA_END=1251 /DNA_ORIENTATION=- /assembly_acc=CAM_ASM_000160